MVIFQMNDDSHILLPPLVCFRISKSICNLLQNFLFDSKTSWTPHIKILRSKCLSFLNILEYLFHFRTGCNRKLLLQLYNSCRKAKSTLMALTNLDSEITVALANKSELFSFLFYMENAFLRVWSHQICLELYRIGLRGNLPQFCIVTYKKETLEYRLVPTIPPFSLKQTVYHRGSLSAVPRSY